LRRSAASEAISESGIASSSAAFGGETPRNDRGVNANNKLYREFAASVGIARAGPGKVISYILHLASIIGLGYAAIHFIANYYGGLSAFILTNPVGLIGTIGIGLAVFIIWLKWLSSYQLKSRSIESIINEQYPLENGVNKQRLIKEVISSVNEFIAADQIKSLSPLKLLERVPFSRYLIAKLAQNNGGRVILSGIGLILNVFTMYILYEFLLRHMLIPLALAFNAHSLRMPEATVIAIINQAKKKLAVEGQNKGAVTLKEILTVKYVINFSDSQIITLAGRIKEAKSLALKFAYILPLGFFVVSKAFFSLAIQRVWIGIISKYITPSILGIFFSPALLNLFQLDLSFSLRGEVPFPITPHHILSSFFTVFFLDLPMK